MQSQTIPTESTPEQRKELIARFSRLQTLVDDARYEISGATKQSHVGLLLEAEGFGFRTRLALVDAWRSLLQVSTTAELLITELQKRG